MKAREMIKLAYGNSEPIATPYPIETKLATPHVAYKLYWGYTIHPRPPIDRPYFWGHTERYIIGVWFAKGKDPLLSYQNCFYGDDKQATIANARAYIDSLRDELEGIE